MIAPNDLAAVKTMLLEALRSADRYSSITDEEADVWKIDVDGNIRVDLPPWHHRIDFNTDKFAAAVAAHFADREEDIHNNAYALGRRDEYRELAAAKAPATVQGEEWVWVITKDGMPECIGLHATYEAALYALSGKVEMPFRLNKRMVQDPSLFNEEAAKESAEWLARYAQAPSQSPPEGGE